MGEGRLSRAQRPQLSMSCRDWGSLPTWAPSVARRESAWWFWRRVSRRTSFKGQQGLCELLTLPQKWAAGASNALGRAHRHRAISGTWSQTPALLGPCLGPPIAPLPSDLAHVPVLGV